LLHCWFGHLAADGQFLVSAEFVLPFEFQLRLLQMVIESLDFAEESGNLFSLSFDRTKRSIPLKLILVRQINERAQCGTVQMRAMADLGTAAFVVGIVFMRGGLKL